MKHLKTYTGHISALEYHSNTRNGNSRWQGVFESDCGDTIQFITESDSGYTAYARNYFNRGSNVKATIGEHYGKTTLDTIEELQHEN